MSPVAVVTGAGRGIGAACIHRLSEAGWSLVLVDAPPADPALTYPPATFAELEAVAEACPGPALALAGDARDPDDLARAVAAAEDHFGGLDAAVACAGVVGGGKPAWETGEDTWRAIVDGNLTTVWRLVRAAVPAMLRRPEPRHGRFVAIASVAGLQGLAQLSAYAASKHGVIGLIRSLAIELGPLGITANAVCPGSTATPMLDESARMFDLPGVQEFARYHPIGRVLEPAEVAAVVTALLDPAWDAVTGAVLPVDGGMSA
jgi:SDR family mycofactocin-dependent oxidoreductase